MGGGAGATQLTRGEIAKRARCILESDDYQVSLKERIRDKELPAAVETMLWYYAFGKPMEQVQITMMEGQEDLSTMSVDELLAKAKSLEEALEEAMKLEEALPVEYKIA